MAIFGTRPEAIKMAPVIRALEAEPQVRVTCVVTAQHREMLDQVVDLFGLRPHIDLNIMQADQSLFQITRRALEGLEPVLEREKPDLVLVQGDTTTAFAAGLAAFYRKIPVGHIEAGLRTERRYDPFPEEMNRRLLTRLADLQFAPTPRARENLLREGIPAEDIFLTGNTVTDALAYIAQHLPPGLPPEVPPVPAGSRILLVETHRRENLGAPMEEICRTLRNIVQNFTDCHLVFSVHRNPRVREVVIPALQGRERVILLDPVDYPTLVRLMRESYLILTDSGGIQEEAPSLGKPVLVLRRTTERPEGIASGNALLVGTDAETIWREASRLLTDREAYARMSRAANPYGDGQAARRTVQAILYRFGRSDRRPDEFGQAAEGLAAGGDG
jgi:UDP-N-acetylglucosamine 2-epimerase (non-hydrolysing)